MSNGLTFDITQMDITLLHIIVCQEPKEPLTLCNFMFGQNRRWWTNIKSALDPVFQGDLSRHIPASTIRLSNVGPMLASRLRRRLNTGPTVGRCVVFAEITLLPASQTACGRRTFFYTFHTCLPRSARIQRSPEKNGIKFTHSTTNT